MRIKYTARSSKVSISSFIVVNDAKSIIEMRVTDAIARKLNCNDYRMIDDLVFFGNSKKNSCPTESITVCYPDVFIEIDDDDLDAFENKFAKELAEKEASSQAWRAEKEAYEQEQEKGREEGFFDGLKGIFKKGRSHDYQLGHEDGVGRAKSPLM
jgi:hypothetical protein